MQFYVVYITEAHAVDGRSPIPLGVGPRRGTSETSRNVSESPEVCTAKMEIKEIPTLIDGMNNTVGAAYQGHPDRLYLVGTDGNIAYKGGPGPFGFLPDELEESIQAELELLAEATEAEWISARAHARRPRLQELRRAAPVRAARLRSLPARGA